ncbi:MAG: FimV/HubP family polar landmark protein, partial [Pseudomonadales bacterium]
LDDDSELNATSDDSEFDLSGADDSELDLDDEEFSLDDDSELNATSDDSEFDLSDSDDSELDLDDEEFSLDDDSELDLGDDDGDSNTKLDLARAYIDMGDNEGARKMLQQVIKDGSDTEVQRANELLENID